MEWQMMRSANIYMVARGRLVDACEPWGYLTPVLAAVVTRATGV